MVRFLCNQPLMKRLRQMKCRFWIVTLSRLTDLIAQSIHTSHTFYFCGLFRSWGKCWRTLMSTTTLSINSLPRYRTTKFFTVSFLICAAASEGCKWRTQWRCQAHKGGSRQLDQSDILSDNTPQPEATRQSWSSEWYCWSLVMSHWTFMEWRWVCDH